MFPSIESDWLKNLWELQFGIGNSWSHVVNSANVRTQNYNLKEYNISEAFFKSNLKSVHFKKTVAQSSFLSKLWYFSIQQQQQVPQFWLNEDRATVFLTISWIINNIFMLFVRRSSYFFNQTKMWSLIVVEFTHFVHVIIAGTILRTKYQNQWKSVVIFWLNWLFIHRSQ